MIVAAIRGPHTGTRPDATTSCPAGDAAMRVERLQQPGKEVTGRRHAPGVARHTAPAGVDLIGPPCQPLMKAVLRRAHLTTAFTRVQANQGAPGIDGMTVDELPAYLRKAWPSMREPLRHATDEPAPVRMVPRPKPGGGTRRLGMPSVLTEASRQRSGQGWDRSSPRTSRPVVMGSDRAGAPSRPSSTCATTSKGGLDGS
jgi:hypothetical protein